MKQKTEDADEERGAREEEERDSIHDGDGAESEDEDDEEDEDDDDDDDEEDEDDKEEARRSAKAKHDARTAKSADRKSQSNPLVLAAVALAIGGGVGWFAADARANQEMSAKISPATVGSAGPCKAWEQKICEGTGQTSQACGQAKGASDLLPPGACGIALEDVPASLAKVKAARADCDTLVTKLCAELGKETDTCKMVTERTASFPPKNCTDMLGKYDQVLAQLKQLSAGMGPRAPGGPGAQRVNPHGTPGASPAAPVKAAPTQ